MPVHPVPDYFFSIRQYFLLPRNEITPILDRAACNGYERVRSKLPVNKDDMVDEGAVLRIERPFRRNLPQRRLTDDAEKLRRELFRGNPAYQEEAQDHQQAGQVRKSVKDAQLLLNYMKGKSGDSYSHELRFSSAK